MANRPFRLKLATISAAFVCILGMTRMSSSAQQKPAAAPKAQWAVSDVLPLTCAQAWEKAGKTYPKMLSIMVTLARVSLANRDLTFPDTREAGLEAGKRIADDCKADPDGLLFAIVDKHVRHIAEPATASGQ
jgi:hypothetical protein